MAMTERRTPPSAQASIELLAALPVLALAAALALQPLLVGYSMTIADGAAEAGALAGTSGRDAKRAAVDALPGWARARRGAARRAAGPPPGRHRRGRGGGEPPAAGAGRGRLQGARGELGGVV